MNVSKVYLRWALRVGGVGLLLGLCASGMLVLALRGALPLPVWLWLLARCLVVTSWLCFSATVVLVAMDMSKRFREWVEGGVGRCGVWIRGLF